MYVQGLISCFSSLFYFFMFWMAPTDVAGIVALVRREGLL